MSDKKSNINLRSLEEKQTEIFKILFETAGEGILVADVRGTILIVNPRMEELFGYQKDELIGEKVELLVPDSFKKNHVKKRESYTHTPEKRPMGINLTLSGKRKDSTLFPIEISLNHFKSENDLYVMALITDITQRKEAENKLNYLNIELETRVIERTKELEQSQKLYSIISQNFPNGIINVLDKNLNYIFSEGKELQKQNIDSVGLIGKKYSSKFQDVQSKNIEVYLSNVFKGISMTFDVKIKENNYLISAVPLIDRNNSIEQILVVEQNVTDQKKAEEKIRNALKKEQDLNELKSRFVSMASHEFRTPLATILSSTTLLSKYEGVEYTEKRKKHLTRIKQNVTNLTGILNDFLSLDKLETGKISTQISLFNIESMIYDLCEEMQEAANENQIIQYKHTGIKDILSDKNILRNILINLISNAIKYSQKDIFIESVVEKKQLELSIMDHGIGIPITEQKHLFERFFRARNSTTIQGTGLGLNIVKRYLTLINGEIEFQSEEGKGTTFYITLPL